MSSKLPLGVYQYALSPIAFALRAAICALASTSPALAEQATTLPAIEVSANRDNARTEGTGAYTTGTTATATGLSLSVRDTPQSVSVMTRERIEDQGLDSITDVINNITGVSAKEFDTSRHGYSARGFDIDNIQIDGIPVTWSPGWSAGETQTDTAIYDRVEVVRGATGLMTGAGNPSAAINLVRKRADSRELKGSVEVGAGSWDHYAVMGDVTTPLTQNGNVRLRAVGSYTEQDSFFDYYHNEKTVLYGIVETDITDATRLSLGASRQENDPTGSMWGGLPAWYDDGTRTDWDRSKTTAPKWAHWASITETQFAELRHAFDNDWILRAVASRSENSGDLKLLFLSGRPNKDTGLGMGASPAIYYTNRSQDDLGLHLNGPFQLFGRDHELSAGVMHSEQDFTADNQPRVDGTVANVGNFNEWDGSFPEPEWQDVVAREDTITKQTGTYAAVRISVTDPLKLILGTRISHWERESHLGAFDPIKHSGEVTPYAGIVYDLNATHSVYASYTDIFNPQNTRDQNGNYLDPLIGNSYETGLKGEYLDGNLQSSFALFRIEQDNLGEEDGVVQNPDGTSTSEIAYRAVDGVVSKGYEIEVLGKLSPGWDMSLGWSHFEARTPDDQDANSRHPRRLLKLFSKYRFQGELQKLALGGGVNWESENYMQTTNPVTGASERLQQSSYALVDLMASYDFTDALTAQLNVKNVLDEKYYSQIGFYNQYAYGAPRNAMLTLKYQF